jgi:L-ascorbate metabolism protein UlaG (beta-lactamase superfamily)
MVITYHGGGCFKITTGGVTILTDPESGRFKGDIVLRTQFPISNFQFPNADIVGPGDYEIKGVEIYGHPFPGENKSLQTAYLVKAEDLNLVFLGNAVKLAEADILEKFDGVDILFLPPSLAKAVKQFNPKIAVAAFYKNAKEVAKEFEKVEELDKLTIKKKDLGEKLRIVVLKNE